MLHLLLHIVWHCMATIVPSIVVIMRAIMPKGCIDVGLNRTNTTMAIMPRQCGDALIRERMVVQWWWRRWRYRTRGSGSTSSATTNLEWCRAATCIFAGAAFAFDNT